jgi:hypothetical protein
MRKRAKNGVDGENSVKNGIQNEVGVEKGGKRVARAPKSARLG